MRTVDQWLDAYAESHLNPTNKQIHRVAVPVIVVDVLGLLWVVPSPVNLGVVAAVLGILYYFRLSPSLGAGMTFLAAGALGLLAVLEGALGSAFLPGLVVVFVAAWAAQFYGHQLEGKKPSFFEDLQFLLIGPIWILAASYRRWGVTY